MLRKRAEAFIPGGMWGHMSVKKLPFGYPQFFSKAKDSRIWDLDGNCYIDFMCGYGPNILGYNNADVDHAVNEQRKKLDLGNGPSALVVDLAEKITTLVDSADWALFAKNGRAFFQDKQVAQVCLYYTCTRVAILGAHATPGLSRDSRTVMFPPLAANIGCRPHGRRGVASAAGR